MVDTDDDTGQTQDASLPTPPDATVSPDVQAAFDRTFGGESDALHGPTRFQEQRNREQSEELQDQPGATAVDDGVEPDAGETDGAGEQDTVVDSEPDADQKTEADAGDGSPTLNPLLRQAAKRAKWKDETIDAFWEQNPEVAEQTFGQLHASQNALTAEYARLGRSQTPAPDEADADSGGDDEVTERVGEVYSAEQLEAMTDQYGPQFIDLVVSPLVESMRGALDQAAEQQGQAVLGEITQFFDSQPEMFASLYGKGSELSDEQRETRTQLCMYADQIKNGARLQGIDLPVSECLERAHLARSHEHIAELERKRIQAEVQGRSRQITNRPTTRKSGAGDGKPSKTTAEQAYRQKAAELGIEL